MPQEEDRPADLANLRPALRTTALPFSRPHTRASASTAHSASVSSQSSIQTQDLSREQVDQKPWKYIGYKGYVQLITSENDFFIFRKFAAASARVSLALQDQVSVLEERLLGLDRQFNRKEAEDTDNGSFRDDDTDRKQIIDDLHKKLVEYRMSKLIHFTILGIDLFKVIL